MASLARTICTDRWQSLKKREMYRTQNSGEIILYDGWRTWITGEWINRFSRTDVSHFWSCYTTGLWPLSCTDEARQILDIKKCMQSKYLDSWHPIWRREGEKALICGNCFKQMEILFPPIWWQGMKLESNFMIRKRKFSLWNDVIPLIQSLRSSKASDRLRKPCGLIFQW